MTSPFRDEIETLRRENERLRDALAAARARRARLPRLGVGVVLLVVDMGTAMALRPWLNDGSDGRFWGALCILGVITLAAVLAAVGYKPR